MTQTDGEPLLRLRGVSKSFGAVHALQDVSLDIDAGQVTALAGQYVTQQWSHVRQ